MRQTIFILLLSYASAAQSQTLFMDAFKNAKWKSVGNFNDSTIIYLDEIKLAKMNPNSDTLRHQPTVWIFNEELKIKYYFNVAQTKDSITQKTSAKFNILNCKYIYDNDKSIFTITFPDKNNLAISYRPAIISTGSFIVLTRVKKDGSNKR